MSLGSFLHKVANEISDFFKGLKPLAQQAVHIGVAITDVLNKIQSNETVDLLEAMIGGLTKKVGDLIAANLPKIGVELKLLDASMLASTPEEAATALQKAIAQIGGDFRKDFLDSLAVQIALVAADGKVTWDEVKQVTKWYYDNKYKKDPAAATAEIHAIAVNAGEQSLIAAA